MANCQIFSHRDMVQGWLIGFATEDESAQPHVQECPVLNFTQGTIFHMILDI
jgi:hypothetical protein